MSTPSDPPPPAPALSLGSYPLTPDHAAAQTLIVALFHRYASLARDHVDHAQTAALFTADGTIEFPDGRVLKPADLGKVTGSDPPKILRHHLTTVDVQLDSEDEARVQAYVVAGTDRKMPDHWGRWNGLVRRDGAKWAIVRMVVAIDGVDDGGWLAGMLGNK